VKNNFDGEGRQTFRKNHKIGAGLQERRAFLKDRYAGRGDQRVQSANRKGMQCAKHQVGIFDGKTGNQKGGEKRGKKRPNHEFLKCSHLNL